MMTDDWCINELDKCAISFWFLRLCLFQYPKKRNLKCNEMSFQSCQSSVLIAVPDAVTSLY